MRVHQEESHSIQIKLDAEMEVCEEVMRAIRD
jgi:hypothetical protein